MRRGLDRAAWGLLAGGALAALAGACGDPAPTTNAGPGAGSGTASGGTPTSSAAAKGTIAQEGDRPTEPDEPLPVPLPITRGGGAGDVKVGASLADVERVLGRCRRAFEVPPTRLCGYPAWGLEVGLEDGPAGGRVVRVSMLGAGRAALSFGGAKAEGYRGATAEGVGVGTARSEVEAKLGAPKRKAKGRPSAPGEPAPSVWQYDGLAVELGDAGVVALHVPRAPMGR